MDLSLLYLGDLMAIFFKFLRFNFYYGKYKMNKYINKIFV